VRAFLLWATLPLVLALSLPALAPAALEDLYEEYLTLGGVRGCAHSEAELEDALKDIPADIRAYDPGFAAALTAGLERRAAGCAAEEERFETLVPLLSGTTEADDGSPGPAGATAAGRPSPPRSAGGSGGSWVAVLFGALGLAVAALFFALRGRGANGAARAPTDE
jgi:hypothetical protein